MHPPVTKEWTTPCLVYWAVMLDGSICQELFFKTVILHCWWPVSRFTGEKVNDKRFEPNVAGPKLILLSCVFRKTQKSLLVV